MKIIYLILIVICMGCTASNAFRVIEIGDCDKYTCKYTAREINARAGILETFRDSIATFQIGDTVRFKK